MEATFTVSVGEEGKDFITLPIVSNPHNPGFWDICVSCRDYYHATDRQPVTLYVNGDRTSTNQLELFVRHISHFEPTLGALLLIGQVRDLVGGRFYEVEVFYSVRDVALERAGRVRVYRVEDEESFFGTPEEIQSLFGAIMTIPMS